LIVAMPMPFDATLKTLARENPRAFLTAFDRPPTAAVTLLNVDLSTVTTAADLVVGVGDPLQEIVHIDFQASASATKHADILVYNALLHRNYQVPVHSMVILLRPQAAHPNLHGTVNYAARPERGKMEFGYEVVRLWERSAEELLSGDLGTVPLEMLGNLSVGVVLEVGLSDIAQRLMDRLEREAQRDQARKLLTAAFLLAGLRVKRETANQVFRKASGMRESDTYMAILEEGQEKEAREIILRLGAKRFQPADDAVRTNLSAIHDLERLHRLMDRLNEASTWQDLLDTP
jgi:predicted transposase YdaD